MKKLISLLVMLVVVLVALPAFAQEIDPSVIDDLLEGYEKFESGAWMLGVAVAARIVTSIVKGFKPLWDQLEGKPHLKWIYPATIALLIALATAPLLTDNWILVFISAVVAAALSGFAAIGWYHGPTWIGGSPTKHADAYTVKKGD